jgi:hypothetical protein
MNEEAQDVGPGRKEYEGDRSADLADRQKISHDSGPGRKEYEGDRSSDKAERLKDASDLRDQVAGAEKERRRDPGPSGTQYAADLKTSRIRNGLSLLVVASTFILAVLAMINALAATPKDDAVRGCQINRTAISGIYQRQIDQMTDPVTIKQTLKFLPEIKSQEQLARLQAPQIEALQKQMATVDPDDCASLFG